MALYLRISLTAVLLCLLPAVSARAQGTPRVGPPVLSAAALDFGSQFTGVSSAMQMVLLTNTGTFALDQSIFTTSGPNSGDFTLGTSCGDFLLAGGGCWVSAIFTPSRLGPEKAVLTFTNTDYLHHPYPQSIALSGTGIPAAVASPSNLNLTSLFSGGPSIVQTITLNNAGRDSLNQGSFLLSGANASDFLLTTSCGTIFTGGRTCSVSVIFTPASSNDETATLSFTDSDVDTGIPYTQTIALHGAASPGVPMGVAEIIGKHSGKALEVLDASSADGAPVEQGVFQSRSDQQWQLIAVESGYYKIQNAATGKVLDVIEASTENGAAVQQWDYLGTDNQKWQLTHMLDGSFEIANKGSGKLLDVTGLSLQDGAAMQQWSSTGADNQRWMITSQQYFTITSVNSNKVLDVTGYSLQDGGLIQQWAPLGGANQQWQFVPLGNGYYEIVNRLSGKALDVTDLGGAAVADGALVQQYAYSGLDNQQWQLLPTGSGYYKIVNRSSGKVLDVIGVSTSDGAGIQVYTYLAGWNQQWRLDPVTP